MHVCAFTWRTGAESWEVRQEGHVSPLCPGQDGTACEAGRSIPCADGKGAWDPWREEVAWAPREAYL